MAGKAETVSAPEAEGSWREHWSRRRLSLAAVLLLLVALASCAAVGMGRSPVDVTYLVGGAQGAPVDVVAVGAPDAPARRPRRPPRP